MCDVFPAPLLASGCGVILAYYNKTANCSLWLEVPLTRQQKLKNSLGNFSIINSRHMIPKLLGALSILLRPLSTEQNPYQT